MGFIVRSGKIERVLVARLKKNSDLLLSIKGIVIPIGTLALQERSTWMSTQSEMLKMIDRSFQSGMKVD